MVGGNAGDEAPDPTQPQKALLAIGEQFLTLTRENNALGQFRSVYGAAGAQPEACRAFYRQGAERLIGELAAYLRRADAGLPRSDAPHKVRSGARSRQGLE